MMDIYAFEKYYLFYLYALFSDGSILPYFLHALFSDDTWNNFGDADMDKEKNDQRCQ